MIVDVSLVRSDLVLTRVVFVVTGQTRALITIRVGVNVSLYSLLGVKRLVASNYRASEFGEALSLF